MLNLVYLQNMVMLLNQDHNLFNFIVFMSIISLKHLI